MNISIIMATRNEDQLAATVSAARDCAGECEVIVVTDGQEQKLPKLPKRTKVLSTGATPRGCQFARDMGIAAATRDVVCVVDPHMDFEEGLFDAIVDAVQSSPRDVFCARCCHMAPGRGRTAEDGYSGAYVQWQEGATPLVLKWRDVTAPAEVPAVLGACYAFRRDWYMDTLRRPWQAGTGWGCDEEILSIATYLMGGTSRVVEKRAWHQFREANQLPWTETAGSMSGRMANRARLVLSLPMPEDWKKELVGAYMADAAVRSQQVRIAQLLDAAAIRDYRAYLATGKRTMEEWRQQYCIASDCRPANGGDITRRPRYMAGAKATATTETHAPGTITGPCTRCGNNGPHRERLPAYQNGNRPVWCGNCGQETMIFAHGVLC